MDINKERLKSITTANSLIGHLRNIIESELDKDEYNADYYLVDVLIETNELITLTVEMLDKRIL